MVNVLSPSFNGNTHTSTLLLAYFTALLNRLVSILLNASVSMNANSFWGNESEGELKIFLFGQRFKTDKSVFN